MKILDTANHKIALFVERKVRKYVIRNFLGVPNQTSNVNLDVMPVRYEVHSC